MVDRRWRVLALDIDGTLLGPDGRLTPATRDAVARAARAGLRPVLCTGRRYRRALPVAAELGLDAPLVCNSGALVKESGGRTLWRADLEPEIARAVLDLFEARGRPVVAMLDGDADGLDFLIPRVDGCPHFRDYLGRNAPHARVDPARLRAARPIGHFHLFAIGDRPAMLRLEAEVASLAGGRVRTFVQRSPAYAGTMCEVLDAGAGKWAALLQLAARWGVEPERIVAVGDDMNDVPMLAGAGLGVAMGHAPEPVRAVADRVLDGGNDGPALARFLDELLDRHE